MPKLNVYGLGSSGVNVDKSPLQLDDNDLTKAQNAVPMPGVKGSIKKRPGLVKFDTDVAAGSISGFIGAPLGPGPGAGTDDESVYFVANAAGTWFQTSNSFSTSTTVSTLATAVSPNVPSLIVDRRLYYVSGTTIRVFDGIKDALFSTLNAAYTIRCLGRHGTTILVGVKVSTSGYILAMDTEGRVRQLGAVLPSNVLPRGMAVHQNRLYAQGTLASNTRTIYSIRYADATDTTAWTLEASLGGGTAPVLALTQFVSAPDGLLYMTFGGDSGIIVYVRPVSGVWVQSLGSGASSGAAGTSLAVFNGTLYVATYNNPNGAAANGNTVQKYEAGAWGANVLNDTTATLPLFGHLYVAGNKLFYVQSGRSYVHYTTDGTTWTQVSVSSAIVNAFGYFPTGAGSGPAFGATSSFVLLQGGASLQLYNQAGTLSTLTLPSAITLDTNRPPRFTIYDRFIVMVNTPSRPITIDAAGSVRVLTPLPPTVALTLDDDGGAGNLSGDYKALQTYVIRDSDGNIIAESDYGPAMDAAFVAAADTLDAEGVNLSSEAVTDSRLYRTTNGGAVYFQWIDVNGNALTQSVSDDTTDGALSLVAAPSLGTCPNMSLVASWRGRLWGVDRADVDYARYSEAGVMYAWPALNSLLIGRAGADARGITAFIPRRDALGIGRRDGLYQVTGSTQANYNVVTLSEACGVESQETVKVYRDVAYFLWKDGVYRWGPTGIDCISDGKVRDWFVSDTYFNRGRFTFAFAGIDPVNNRYRLFLAALGSVVEDRYVEYDIQDGTWWGPHKTAAFTTFTAAGGTADSNDRFLPLIASSDGYLWKNQATQTDNTSDGIDFEITTKRHDGLTPDIEKNWGQLSLISKVQAAGSLTVTPYVGSLNAAAGTAITADMTKGREKLPRMGAGKHCGFTFSHTTNAQDVELYGYELPFYELGRR